VSDEELHPLPDTDSVDIDETPDASNPESMRRQRRKVRRIEDRRADFWKRVMADPDGRLVIWELLEKCGVYQNRFGTTPSGFPAPDVTWFHLGQKDIGDHLYKMLLRVDRAAVALMHDEHDPEFAKPKRGSAATADDV
jgi:hypothetical protein